VQLSPLEHSPPSTTTRVIVVLSLPRELNALFTAAAVATTIEPPLHGAELEATKVILCKRDVPRHDEIDVLAIPTLHLDNPPRAEEGIRRATHDR
jgi:hypothetical protein